MSSHWSDSSSAASLLNAQQLIVNFTQNVEHFMKPRGVSGKLQPAVITEIEKKLLK